MMWKGPPSLSYNRFENSSPSDSCRIKCEFIMNLTKCLQFFRKFEETFASFLLKLSVPFHHFVVNVPFVERHHIHTTHKRWAYSIYWVTRGHLKLCLHSNVKLMRWHSVRFRSCYYFVLISWYKFHKMDKNAQNHFYPPHT